MQTSLAKQAEWMVNLAKQLNLMARPPLYGQTQILQKLD